MGKPKRRVSPRLANRVNRDFDHLMALSIMSVVEAAFASIKRCWGPDITSIKGWLKRRELAIKVVAYNLKRALYVEQGKERGIHLWLNCQ